jgi:UDP-GlcNAc:undecaprenyl-phosphate GlcNAc-1-phosphate transferase
VSSLPLWGYAVVLAGSLALSLVLTPVALGIALRMSVFDHPGPAKAHQKAVPYLGGAAIVVSFAAVVLVATAIRPPPNGLAQLAGFLGLAVLLAVIGLVDDLEGGLSPLLRLALEGGAGLAVWSMGYAAHLPGVPSGVDAAVTVIWVAGVTNAFNLLDNMDGLSAGVTTITALSIFTIAWLQHRYLVAALAVALAGCAAGFLRHNFHPARIYMGDAGSLFLGFMVAVLLLKLRADAPTRVDIAVILAVPGVALFDTTLVMVSRTAHRRSPFQGGQDHSSHRLVHLGLPVRGAVIITYVAGAVLGGAAVAMVKLGPVARAAGAVGLLVAAALVAVPLARAPVYELRWADAKGRNRVPRAGRGPARGATAEGPTVAEIPGDEIRAGETGEIRAGEPEAGARVAERSTCP